MTSLTDNSESSDSESESSTIRDQILNEIFELEKSVRAIDRTLMIGLVLFKSIWAGRYDNNIENNKDLLDYSKKLLDDLSFGELQEVHTILKLKVEYSKNLDSLCNDLNHLEDRFQYLVKNGSTGGDNFLTKLLHFSSFVSKEIDKKNFPNNNHQ